MYTEWTRPQLLCCQMSKSALRSHSPQNSENHSPYLICDLSQIAPPKLFFSHCHSSTSICRDRTQFLHSNPKYFIIHHRRFAVPSVCFRPSRLCRRRRFRPPPPQAVCSAPPPKQVSSTKYTQKTSLLIAKGIFYLLVWRRFVLTAWIVYGWEEWRNSCLEKVNGFDC